MTKTMWLYETWVAFKTRFPRLSLVVRYIIVAWPAFFAVHWAFRHSWALASVYLLFAFDRVMNDHIWRNWRALAETWREAARMRQTRADDWEKIADITMTLLKHKQHTIVVPLSMN